MNATVYVETTIPSAYVTTRTDAASVFRREQTRAWWKEQLGHYDCLTSDGVWLELDQGEWPGKAEALELIGPLRRCAIDEDVIAVARRYVAERLVPAGLDGDALHLAAACVHDLDFLLTWNIRHLANPNKLDHLIVINRRLGLLTPRIVTPESLWMEESP